jgi:hypothetical protein
MQTQSQVIKSGMQTREMVDAQPKTPNSGNVWYNSADGNFLKPRLFSVPVYTILGDMTL